MLEVSCNVLFMYSLWAGAHALGGNLIGKEMDTKPALLAAFLFTLSWEMLVTISTKYFERQTLYMAFIRLSSGGPFTYLVPVRPLLQSFHNWRVGKSFLGYQLRQPRAVQSVTSPDFLCTKMTLVVNRKNAFLLRNKFANFTLVK